MEEDAEGSAGSSTEPSTEPNEPDERARRRLERLLPELIKRVVEAGVERISEGPKDVRQFVSDLKLPKEALALILAQLDETKNGLYRAVSREIRDFLEHTNFSEEMARALTRLSLEVKTEVRFIPNSAQPGATPKPDVRSRVSIKRDGRSTPPPPEEAEEAVPDARASSRPPTVSPSQSPTDPKPPEEPDS